LWAGDLFLKESIMRQIIGFVLMVIGVVLGLYVGIWVCFVGGIVDVIMQIRAEHLQAGAVAWGVAKVVFATLFGWLSAFVLVIPGYTMLNWD
jgi:hypothetical protein